MTTSGLRLRHPAFRGVPPRAIVPAPIQPISHRTLMPYTRALIAEAIGTFALCFVGLLAIANPSILGATGGAALGTIALAHGLTIAVMVAALSQHSGAHFNPAVTFGFLITRRMEPLKAGLYFAAQIFGATLGSALVAAMYDFGAVAP